MAFGILKASSRWGTRVTRRDILFIIPALEIGGAELQLAAVASRLVQNGWNVSVYSLAGAGSLATELKSNKVSVFIPPLRGVRDSRLRVNSILRRVLISAHLIFLLMKLRPFIVHFRLPPAYLIGAPLAIITGVPVRVMSRHSLNLYQRGRPLSRIAERILHRRMHAVIAVSLSVLGELQDKEGVPANRLGVIYNGVDHTRFLDVPVERTILELGLNRNTFVMVIVANLIPYKGHSDLLQAIALAKPDLPDDWRLLIVGRDEGIGEQLRDLSKRLSIEQRVSFLGERTDVVPILCCSHVGIVCSHQEGFSIATIEGMAAGLPMIVTDVGGLSELIVDGESGLVVPAKEPLNLAKAIGRLANDPQLRVRLGHAGKRRAEQKFSLETTVSQYERLYLGLCKPAPRTVSEILARGLQGVA